MIMKKVTSGIGIRMMILNTVNMVSLLGLGGDQTFCVIYAKASRK